MKQIALNVRLLQESPYDDKIIETLACMVAELNSIKDKIINDAKLYKQNSKPNNHAEFNDYEVDAHDFYRMAQMCLAIQELIPLFDNSDGSLDALIIDCSETIKQAQEYGLLKKG